MIHVHYRPGSGSRSHRLTLSNPVGQAMVISSLRELETLIEDLAIMKFAWESSDYLTPASQDTDRQIAI